MAWQRLNVGAKLQKDQFSQILGEVWKELEPRIIRNGFKKGGVFPFNSNVIPHEKFDPDSLKRFLEFKSKNIEFDVPSLSSLCLKILNKENNEREAPKKPCECTQQQSLTTTLKPSEVIIPGTSKGTTGIQILENRIITYGHGETFEDLLLSTIKKGDNTAKVKKRKAAKGCEIITRECYLEKLRNEEAEKQKR